VEVLIEVIDSGPGLKDTENIFDAFITTKEKRDGHRFWPFPDPLLKGTTGQLWAENNPDFGAKF